MKILITGATGFVGTHLIDLLKSDHEVIGLDRKGSIEDSESVRYKICDLLNKNDLTNILGEEKPDVIFHLAALAVTWKEKPKNLFDVNLLGTLNLYESIIELKDSTFNPKIIFISSAEVYGKVENPENITERDALMPVNFYGSSKTAADRLSYQVSQTNGLRILILRPFPHAGPGQGKGFFIPDVASQIIELENTDKNELFVGNLEGIRDYTDIRDVIKIYKYFIESDFKPGDVFNICSGKGIKIREVLELLIKDSSKNINVKQDPSKFRPVDVPIYVGNNQKLINATDWKPEIQIEQTIKDTLDYWRRVWKDKTEHE